MNPCLANPLKIAVPGIVLGLVGLSSLAALRAPLLQAKPAAKPAAEAATAGGLKAGSYEIDPVHSTVVFRILHMNVSPFWGRFNDVSGNFTIDPAKPEDAKLDVKIQAGSIDTNNDKRNQDVMGPDLLGAKEFPTIEFLGDKVKKVKDGVYEVAGALTLHGETKDLTIQIEQTGFAEGRRGAMAGFETTFTIKRSEYGMTGMQDALGDEVRITVGIEGHAG